MERFLLLAVYLAFLPPIIFLPPKSLASFLLSPPHKTHPSRRTNKLEYPKSLSVEEIEPRRCDLSPPASNGSCSSARTSAQQEIKEGVGPGSQRDGSGKMVLFASALTDSRTVT